MQVVATKYSPALGEWVDIPLFESHRHKPCKEWVKANCDDQTIVINGEKWDVELRCTKYHKRGN